ncbi:MAG: hypothetical protein J6X85_04080 [Ruminococcus sp.]|nr:hypothetical protein [Ruminococcus sp.]
MKKIYIIIALVCILACTGCADKNSDKNNVSSAITEQETTVEVTTQAETDITVPTELSAEIPAEAVTKRTEIDFYNDKFEHKSLDYLDEHGNSLLLITTNEDSSEETIVRNSRYEYDSDGNITYDYTINRKNEVIENFYEYDEKGNVIIIEMRINGKPEYITETVYDKYNNEIRVRTSVYENYSSILSTEDTDYDNIEYDDKNRIISKTILYSDDSLYAMRIRYEYDPVCGEVSLEENIEMPDMYTENIISTIKKTYDEKGRIIREESHYNTDDHTEVTEYEYEAI